MDLTHRRALKKTPKGCWCEEKKQKHCCLRLAPVSLRLKIPTEFEVYVGRATCTAPPRPSSFRGLRQIATPSSYIQKQKTANCRVNENTKRGVKAFICLGWEFPEQKPILILRKSVAVSAEYVSVGRALFQRTDGRVVTATDKQQNRDRSRERRRWQLYSSSCFACGESHIFRPRLRLPPIGRSNAMPTPSENNRPPTRLRPDPKSWPQSSCTRARLDRLPRALEEATMPEPKIKKHRF